VSASNTAFAAFPIKNNSDVHKVQQSEVVKRATKYADPTPQIIRPAHELEDIFSLASIILGGIAVIMAFFTGFGLVAGILAIGLGIAALHMDGHKNLAHIGLLLGVAAVVIALIFAIVTF
jgi:hypothetical protein